MKVSRIHFLAVLFAAVCSVASAQTRTPTRILSGFPPGGNVDLLARLFAENLSEATGRTVVVENRPGAVGQIAAEALKSAAPDGNTLMVAPDATVVIRPLTMKKPPFNALDFTPIAHTGGIDYALGISSSIPARDLKEFAAWAKANPAKASFGSAGAGGLTHFLGLMVAQAMGVDLKHVPYKGSGPAVFDVAAGHLPATIQPLGTMLAQARAGKLRVVAVSSAKRSPQGPEVPTFAELGYPSLGVDSWFGIFAPGGMAPELAAELNAIFVQAMRTKAVRERMHNLDLEIRELTAPEFSAEVKASYERWASVIRSSGFNADSE
jgi:tripartite-type tricarboxylate transporter receptor subunit TctC